MLARESKDGGANRFVGQRQQLLLEIESEDAEELIQNFQGSHTFAFPRQGS